jgi:hypothetical protein
MEVAMTTGGSGPISVVSRDYMLRAELISDRFLKLAS